MEGFSFGERVKIMRKMKQLKQEEFANELSVTRSCIANYENDKRMPNYDVLCKMSTIFDVPTDFLLNGTKMPKALKEKFEDMNYFAISMDISEMHPDDKSALVAYKSKLIRKRQDLKAKPNRKYGQR